MGTGACSYVGCFRNKRPHSAMADWTLKCLPEVTQVEVAEWGLAYGIGCAGFKSLEAAWGKAGSS